MFYRAIQDTVVTHLFLVKLNTIKMQKNDICEAIYTLPDVEILRYRKPLAMPIGLLILGLVFFAANSFVEPSIEMSNLKSTLVLIAIALVLIGGIILLIRISGNDNVPYHAGDKCFLKREELRFAKEKKAYISALVEKADFSTLRALKQDGVSAITVTLYSSPRSGFCAAQAFEYEELERKPICKMTYKK